MKGKLYSLLIIVPVACFALLLAGLSFYLQPFYGDLTRIGGYSENQHGWNEPQPGFSVAGTSYVNHQETNEDVDYLVIGDSFSHACKVGKGIDVKGCIQWTGYFKEATGYHGFTFHHDSFSAKQLVEKVKSLELNPQFLVFQSIERYTVSRLQKHARELGCNDSFEREAPTLSNFKETDLPKSDLTRPTNIKPFDLNAPIALVKHRLSKKRRKRVKLVDLKSGSQLFTSKVTDQLLVYYEDYGLKARLGEQDIEEAACGLKALSGYIQKELGIPVIYAITPDKTSIYQDWFVSDRYKMPSIIPALATNDVWYIDLQAPMINAAREGVKDIYQPNDTHWASPGAQIASDELVKLLNQMKSSG